MIIDYSTTVTTPSYIGVRAIDDIEILRDPRHERIHHEAECSGHACEICAGYW